MGEGATAYREVIVATKIATELREAGFLGTPEAPTLQGSHLNEQALEAAGFEIFASFRTNREKIRCVHTKEVALHCAYGKKSLGHRPRPAVADEEVRHKKFSFLRCSAGPER